MEIVYFLEYFILGRSLRSHTFALGGQAKADMPWLVSTQATKRKSYFEKVFNI
jgi:hypothetical protein